MPRGQFQPALGDEIDERSLRRRRRVVDGIDDLFILMRAGDREDVREACANDLGLIAHAAGDDDAAVLGHRLADRLETFRSEEHTSELQSLMRNSYAVFCLKKKKKATRIDQRLKRKR